MALVLRPLFPTPPDVEAIADFRRHVRETGQPETWPSISTMPPPSEGEVVMLARDVEINPKVRPGGGRAPCPLCLPEGDKWLHDGALIWCAESQGVYCIGPDCSSGDLRRKLTIARNLLAQSERERDEARALAGLAARAGLLIGWINDHRGLADAVTVRHRQFAKAVPKLRRVLSDRLKTGLPLEVLRSEGSAALRHGGPFLAGGWNLPADLAKAEDVLKALKRDAASEPDAWSAALAASVRTERLAATRAALRLLERTFDRMAAASAFLSPSAFNVIGRWSRSKEAPTEFEVTWVGSNATITHREEFWRGSLGSSTPRPLPEIDDLKKAA